MSKVDGETALDLAVDEALDGIAGLEGLLQVIPGREALGLLAGQAGDAEAVLDGVEGDFHLVADGDLELAVGADELASGDDALGLESGVDDDGVRGDLHHGTLNDGARLELGVGQTLLKEIGKTFGHGITGYLSAAR